jgi:hypothetical protein
VKKESKRNGKGGKRIVVGSSNKMMMTVNVARKMTVAVGKRMTPVVVGSGNRRRMMIVAVESSNRWIRSLNGAKRRMLVGSSSKRMITANAARTMGLHDPWLLRSSVGPLRRLIECLVQVAPRQASLARAFDVSNTCCSLRWLVSKPSCISR